MVAERGDAQPAIPQLIERLGEACAQIQALKRVQHRQVPPFPCREERDA
jgi:hypothetical protein